MNLDMIALILCVSSFPIVFIVIAIIVIKFNYRRNVKKIYLNARLEGIEDAIPYNPNNEFDGKFHNN